ncbi:MAG: hypothetical protein IJW42_04425 [Alistipes sp.]|nr:hypothetical protein [Alistipes sp.]
MCRVLVALLCGLLFISCGKLDDLFLLEFGSNQNEGSAGTNTKNPLAKKLFGTYKDESGTYYYYLSDGNGYCESAESNNGIYRRVFTWSLDNDNLTRIYLRDGYYAGQQIVGSISFDSEGNLILTGSKGSTTYKRVNNNATTTVKYKEPPFVNYIRIFGIYYKLSSVTMRCFHSSVGTESNFKYLFFYGENGEYKPIGAMFDYCTPYYEGIDKYWSEGSYRITSDSGFWTYGVRYYRVGEYSAKEGILKIKRSNNIMTFDFNLDDNDVVGHFVGAVS